MSVTPNASRCGLWIYTRIWFSEYLAAEGYLLCDDLARSCCSKQAISCKNRVTKTVLNLYNSLFALVTFWPVTMFPSTTTYSQSSSSALEKMPPRSCSLPSMDMGTCCSRLQWLSYASLSPVTRLSSTRYLPFDSLTRDGDGHMAHNRNLLLHRQTLAPSGQGPAYAAMR